MRPLPPRVTTPALLLCAVGCWEAGYPEVRTDCAVHDLLTLESRMMLGEDPAPLVGCVVEFPGARVLGSTRDGWVELHGAVPLLLLADHPYADGSVIVPEGDRHAWVQFLGLRDVETVIGGTRNVLALRFVDPPPAPAVPAPRTSAPDTPPAAPPPCELGAAPPAEARFAADDEDPELAWLAEQERRAASLRSEHPSPARDRIRAEFDRAPRDPVGDDATLEDLYRILRDVDRCAPASSGYTLSPLALRAMRNTPFAAAGYTFASEDLADIFSREPWYRADPAIDGEHPPTLRAIDQDCVTRLRELEGR